MLNAVYHPDYSCPFPEQHRFVMSKFSGLYASLKQQHLLEEIRIHRPGKCKREWLLNAHEEEYVDGFCRGNLAPSVMRRIGLPWSEALVHRSLISPNGTLLTAQLALEHGVACHLAGGTHHAHRNFGSGFCIFNDLAITALKLIQQASIKRVLIFDCDVHQGDGTAAILRDESQVFTCSIHCDKNFPARKATSDLDIEVAVGTSDDAYLKIVDTALKRCLAKHKPDIVLYDAGVDVYQGDPLGKLDVSEAAILQRDKRVLETCLDQSIPIATVIGGGYDDNHAALAERHSIIVKAALSLV